MTKVCLKTELFGNHTGIECMKPILVLISETYCTVRVQNPDKSSFQTPRCQWVPNRLVVFFWHFALAQTLLYEKCIIWISDIKITNTVKSRIPNVRKQNNAEYQIPVLLEFRQQFVCENGMGIRASKRLFVLVVSNFFLNE